MFGCAMVYLLSKRDMAMFWQAILETRKEDSRALVH